ncbi:hydrogenase maturation protease [Paraburkholderia bannensis]|uniref:Hydrogenase maturation protease n=1 Tax=Paraburkholderia bannensis TaxID=765414 RepID=A0A7W9WW01_9BURK|nr:MULTISPECIES: hydrogenase maturation protease [Paraburkholderia]MBB3261237.1 hydrogenase maturation protease [Paraburkholderia sp. WP4_3_2]MBB6106274.1 hydrogenase maturation protease [Paraburkholderia bannensis]
MSFLYEHVPQAFARYVIAPTDSGARIQAAPRIVVLGIGNVQWGDAGFGMRAIERMKAGWQCAPHVDMVAGGIEGRALLPLVETAQRMIVFNAADFHRAPGTLCVREDDEAIRYLGTRPFNLHQMDFADTFACAQLKGKYPRELVLIGVQPLALDDYGQGLRPAISAQLDPAIALACRWLRRWHARPRPRPPGENPLAREDGPPAPA